MSGNKSGQPQWGTCSLDLVLPVAGVHFTGLSGTQADQIAEQYPHFLGSTSHRTRIGTQCAAYRLAQKPILSSKELTKGGQYAPHKVRRSDGIALAGTNFIADIQFGLPGFSFLGVLQEQEFAYPIVLENFLRIYTSYKALELGGAVLHSAGLVFGDCAYIFVGRSNAGKTTLTCKAHKAGAKVLSDDMNLVLPSPEGCRAHAIPFAGEFGRTLDQDLRRSYKVAGIVLLEQGTKLESRAVSASRAVAGLLAGSPFVNDDEHELPTLLDVLDRMVKTVPVCRLRCRRGDSPRSILNEIQKVLKND